MATNGRYTVFLSTSIAHPTQYSAVFIVNHYEINFIYVDIATSRLQPYVVVHYSHLYRHAILSQTQSVVEEQ